MPICSYLIFPDEGRGESLCRRLNAIPGCEAVEAENDDLLILVTDTVSAEEDEALRRVLAELDEIRTMVLVFGEVEAREAGHRGRIERSRVLPVLSDHTPNPAIEPPPDLAPGRP